MPLRGVLSSQTLMPPYGSDVDKIIKKVPRDKRIVDQSILSTDNILNELKQGDLVTPKTFT